MNWVDAIGGQLRVAPMAPPDRAKCKELAKQYWNGEMSDCPCREFLLDRVIAVQQLKGLSDLTAYIRSQVPQHDWKSEEAIEDLVGKKRPSANETD